MGTLDPETVLKLTLPNVIGDVLMALFVGACLILSTICFVLLSSPTGGPPKQCRLLQLYIVTLMVAVVGSFVSSFLLDNDIAVFRSHKFKDDDGLHRHRLLLACLAFQPIPIWMADGLLVWRCYMIQKASMGHSSPFRSITFFGIVGLWVTSFVTGVILMATNYNIPGAALFTSNALTNIYGTAFIIIHLLRHRRMARIYFGDEVSTGRYRGVVSIMLESAAINVPVAIWTAAGDIISSYRSEQSWPDILVRMSIPSQAFASLLVIHQVALGRAIGKQNWEEVAPVMKNEPHSVPENIQIPLAAA